MNVGPNALFPERLDEVFVAARLRFFICHDVQQRPIGPIYRVTRTNPHFITAGSGLPLNWSHATYAAESPATISQAQTKISIGYNADCFTLAGREE
jgi:hypothetical protein